jgi:hypothetical protein
MNGLSGVISKSSGYDSSNDFFLDSGGDKHVVFNEAAWCHGLCTPSVKIEGKQSRQLFYAKRLSALSHMCGFDTRPGLKCVLF